MIIDGNNLVLGRMATHVAKAILNGEKVEIVNCEKIVISGRKEDLIERWTAKTKRGEPFHGPFYPRREDMLVRRTIRGMLPWKESRGKQAFKNVACHIGIPESLKGKKIDTIKEANASRLRRTGYMRIGEISRHIGKSV